MFLKRLSHCVFCCFSSSEVEQPELPSLQEGKIMSSGPCGVDLVVGRLTTGCPCKKGVFDTPILSLDQLCKACEHSLRQHKDSDPTQPGLSRTRGITYRLNHFVTFCLRMADIEIVETQTNPVVSNSETVKPETVKPGLSTTISRSITVQALWSLIQRVGVVHIRGTPASGKSTLALLLETYVIETRLSIPVFRICWTDDLQYTYPPCTPFKRVLNFLLDENFTEEWLYRRCLLIIDEAQSSYKYSGLWNNLIKNVTPDHGPFIALFSSYGSPSAVVTEAQTPTPVLFNQSQRISLLPSFANPDIGLFFSLSEFNEVVDKVCLSYSEHEQKLALADDLREYVWHMTSGHPSAVRAIIDGLATASEFREFRKRSQTISLIQASNFFSDDNKLLYCLESSIHGFTRALPEKHFLQKNPHVTEFLREVAANRISKEDPESRLALNICYRKGWLQSELSAEEEPVYTFTTNMHRRYTEYLVSKDIPPFPINVFPTVRDLCFAATKKFAPTALLFSRGMLIDGEPLEATYQDELYRSCYTLLQQLYLCSEWSGVKGDGRVDFFVRGTTWAIELLRNGDELDEHIARFMPGGRYYHWIESRQIEDYIILDFRRSRPKKKYDDTHVYHVIFSEDFTSYDIRNSKLDPIIEGVAILNPS